MFLNLKMMSCKYDPLTVTHESCRSNKVDSSYLVTAYILMDICRATGSFALGDNDIFYFCRHEYISIENSVCVFCHQEWVQHLFMTTQKTYIDLYGAKSWRQIKIKSLSPSANESYRLISSIRSNSNNNYPNILKLQDGS